MIRVTSTSDQETRNLGKRLGKAISDDITIALTGDLGAGKTTLIQGLAAGLGVSEDYYVTSPSFNIINQYPTHGLALCHVDLYRLSDADELDIIGFEDVLEQGAVVAVEWPDILLETGFEFDLEIRFEFDPDYNRIISFTGSGHRVKNLLSRLSLKI